MQWLAVEKGTDGVFFLSLSLQPGEGGGEREPMEVAPQLRHVARRRAIQTAVPEREKKKLKKGRGSHSQVAAGVIATSTCTIHTLICHHVLTQRLELIVREIKRLRVHSRHVLLCSVNKSLLHFVDLIA
jgi:hypothetical protein